MREGDKCVEVEVAEVVDERVYAGVPWLWGRVRASEMRREMAPKRNTCLVKAKIGQVRMLLFPS